LSKSKLTQKRIQAKDKNRRILRREESTRTIANSAQPSPDKQLAAIRQKAEEKYRKKQLRRQIYVELEVLQRQGEMCETSQILAFAENFSDERELVREVLVQFGSPDKYPLTMIWLFLVDYASNSLEDFYQALETHKQVMYSTQQRDRLASLLVDPCVISVQTTEDGPQFAALTPEHVRFYIKELFEGDLPAFAIYGPFPFHHQGEYSVILDFSHNVTYSLTLRLQAQPDELPEDCMQDFKEVQPLSLDERVDAHNFLREHLASAQSVDLRSYCSLLSEVIVTAYHTGYGKSPWAQEYLLEWRRNWGEYQDTVVKKDIIAAIERINHEVPWILPSTPDGEIINQDTLLEHVNMLRVQDPILGRYDIEASVETRGEDDYKQPYYSVVIAWRDNVLGSIQLQRPPKQLAEVKANQSSENKKMSQGVEQILTKVIAGTSLLTQASLAAQSFQEFVKVLKREVFEADDWTRGNLLDSIQALLAESKKYGSNKDKADAYLSLAHSYGEQDNELFFRYALAEYCFWRGWQRYLETKRGREARLYIQGFLYLYNQIKEGQQSMVREFYRSLALYFSTYTFKIDVREATQTEIANHFYAGLFQELGDANPGQYEALGHCLVELSTVIPRFLPELINRLKTFRNVQQLNAVIAALQEGKIFRNETLVCLQLLARIDVTLIASVLSKQYLASAEERRQVVNALLTIASAPNVSSPTVLLQGFASQAPLEIRARLAFSLLVEPFVLNKPEQESDLKALLIAEALGLPSGQPDTEFFLGIATELSLLFDRFFSSPNPNVKGGFAITILEKIRVTRKKLLEGMRVNQENRSLRDTVNTFFRGTESYVTGEQAKLIRDTTLELMLVSDRTLHSLQRTRITVEIRNIGEGIADRLALEIFPVPGKYEVAERDRLHTIEILVGKTPLQKELFIQPLVGSDESIELSLILRYDTLKKQNKVAELPPSNRTVRFYAADQFVPVKQPYSISAPAETWFYGRKRLLDRMANNLDTATEDDSSMIVFGLKRAGKTSVVKRFIGYTFGERGLSESHIPVYADLLVHPLWNLLHTDGGFLFFLINIIAREISVKHRLSLPFTPSQLQEAFNANPYAAFSFYLDRLITALEGRRILVVLDEFSTLYEDMVTPSAGKELSSRLFKVLSNIIQSTRQLTFIFTGTYVLLEMMRTYMSDLAKICIPYMISFLDETSARQLITVPVQRDQDNLAKGWLEYESRVVDRIVTYTNRHPYLIQCVCHLLVERMNELKDQRVNLNDLDAIVHDIIVIPANENMMLNLWGELNKPQQKVLSVIAALSNTSQSWVESGEIMHAFKEAGEAISQEDIEKICNNLTEAELLEKNSSAEDQNEAYRITIPLYQMWLKHSKPIRSVVGKHSISSPS
jgi:hypothetical protein